MADSSSQNIPASADKLLIQMSDVVGFVRQLSHDLRNHLNAVELQSAYLKEIAADEEVKAELQRLRGMISEFGKSLQQLTSALAPVKLTTMPYEATAFVEDLQQKVASQFPEERNTFAWELDPTTAMLNVDPQLLQQALLELLGNALRHGRGTGAIQVQAHASEEEFTIVLREPKNAFTGSTANWGREPFKFVHHGHYGLGLARARSIIEAHGGKLTALYDPAASALLSTVSLPLARG